MFLGHLVALPKGGFRNDPQVEHESPSSSEQMMHSWSSDVSENAEASSLRLFIFRIRPLLLQVAHQA